MKPLQCQSCGMMFPREDMGTNRDKTLNEDYCHNCYQDGEYTNHHLTLHGLEIQLLEMAKVHNEITLEEAQQIIRVLPDLKRWRMNNI